MFYEFVSRPTTALGSCTNFYLWLYFINANLFLMFQLHFIIRLVQKKINTFHKFSLLFTTFFYYFSNKTRRKFMSFFVLLHIQNLWRRKVSFFLIISTHQLSAKQIRSQIDSCSILKIIFSHLCYLNLACDETELTTINLIKTDFSFKFILLTYSLKRKKIDNPQSIWPNISYRGSYACRKDFRNLIL